MNGKKKKKGSYQAPVSIADMESTTWYATFLKKGVTTFDSPVNIHIHSKRKRLSDADSISAKAAIDGLVHAGLLQDDSPEFVQNVSYSQEKSDEEETIITIEEIK